LPGDEGEGLRRVTLHTKDAPAVDVLHRIAQAAGWSLTIAGLGDERVTLDLTDADAREAVRAVLRASKSWGVLRNDRLVGVPAGDGGVGAGELIDRRGRRRAVRKNNDLVQVLRGDLTVPRGTVVPGDAVVVGGSLAVEPGALIQGDAVALGGGISVEPGAM